MNKSLLIITEAFELGGVETHIAIEAEELARQGWDVHLVCGSRFSPVLVPDNIKSLHVDAAMGPKASIRDFLESIDRIIALAKEKKVSAIHAHPFISMIPALVCASSLRVPLAVTLHGPSSVVGSYGAAYDFLLTSQVLPSASRVLAVSDEVKALAAPYVRPERLLLQPNSVGPVEVANLPSAGERWLVVSRLDSAKTAGVIQFVRSALPYLPGIDICGTGPAQEQLESELAADIASGNVRMLGSSNEVCRLMLGYAGVAGMGRVALEGLVQDVPVVLVGYDGVKGLVTEALYREAMTCNFSGRGLSSLTSEELRLQIATVASHDRRGLTKLVRTEHAPAKIWEEFAVELQKAPPVSEGVVDGYIRQLRAAHPNSEASAYWSREVMDVLGKIVASRFSGDGHLQNSLALYANAYTRTIVEQEGMSLRRHIDGWQTQIGQSISAGAAYSDERILDTLRQEVAGIVDAMRTNTSHVSEMLRIEVGGMSDSMRRSASDIQAKFQGEFERLQGEIKAEAIRSASEMIREIADMRKDMHRLILAGNEESRDAGLAALNEIGGRVERRMEHELERIESEIRTDLAHISEGIDKNAEIERSIEVLRERVVGLERELRNVYESKSWALTRPLRAFRRLFMSPQRDMGPAVADGPSDLTLPSSMASRPGLWRRAINLIARTVRSGRLDPSDQARLASMVRANYAAVTQGIGLEVPRPHLEPASEPSDVFVWSVIDWHFRMQRPQHLAAAMARKGHRVFYISNNFVDSASPGFTVEPLDASGRLFQINLNVHGVPQIYSDIATSDQAAAIRASMAELLLWTLTRKSVSFVQHPYWIEPAQCLPNMQLVYDCMDHHGGFENNASSVLSGEQWLVKRSDLLVVTSQWLYDELAPLSHNAALIRNATEYQHFCNRPDKVFRDGRSRKVIGYYGAIAEWFDVDLVRKVAQDHPDALVLLVGRDTVDAAARLADVPNVRLVGEVPYADLPYWVHGFDVCLLPFRVIPLTLATNPVKVYEYLSAGKPVVSVDLPEMAQFEGLVSLAHDFGDFSTAVTRVLRAPFDEGAAAERRTFAAKQTWAHRAADLDAALNGIVEPLVSVVVLSYNNLEYTQACLHSLEKYSDYPNLEVIVVDNASADGIVEYLEQWAAQGHNRKLIVNETNLGFSAGNNVGLAAAAGDYLVLLNNDTFVTPGWIRSMVAHLRRNPEAGLVGPVTNNIGNEARIDIHYSNMEEMVQVAQRFTLKQAGVSFPLATAAFFCVMLTRGAYEDVGPMDEAFGVGFFEDDDYCRRLEQKGYRVLCAEDVFVHHHLSASFNLIKAEAKQKLFEQNREVYEKKWGPWIPHSYRDRPSH